MRGGVRWIAIGAGLALAACSSTRRVGLDGDLPPVGDGGALPATDRGAERGAPIPDGPWRCADCKLVIGVLVSESGLLAGTQHGIINGAQLACDEINAAGGVLGLRLGLRVEDDGTAPESARQAFDRLVADPEVVAIVGPTSSEAAFALIGAADERRIALVSTSATGDHFAPPSEPVSPFFFRTAPPEHAALAPRGSSALRAAVLRATAGTAQPTGRGMIISNADGRAFTDSYHLLENFVALDFLDPPATYPDDPTLLPDGLSAPVEKALAGNPTFVVLGSLTADGALLTHALGERFSSTYRPALVGHWPLMFDAFLAAADLEAAEGLVGIAPRPPAYARQYALFAQAYRAARGTDPPLFAEGAYDAAYLVAYAVAQLGRADRSALPAALRALSGPPGALLGVGQWRAGLAELAAASDLDYDGAAGPLDWDFRGDPSVPDSRTAYVIYTIRGGRIEIEPVVGPP